MAKKNEVIVLMPAYNAAQYIGEAISSILQQGFKDFDFVICDDCSTDNTLNVIELFKDPRITVLHHPVNMGVVRAMNSLTASIQSHHKYVAIMHADDIAHPTRLQKQHDYLEANPEVAVLSTITQHINEKGEKIAGWELDEKTLTPTAIKKQMLIENCITHSTVMMRSFIIDQYGYDLNQIRSNSYAVEDYPLWLHTLSDDFIIDKLNEKLLDYRVHTNNTTTREYRSRNAYFILYDTKKRYLEKRKEAHQITSFDKKLARQMKKDYLLAVGKNIKTFIKRKIG
jgi:glycosyltransferase involved in cell wall biosynthesis